MRGGVLALFLLVIAAGAWLFFRPHFAICSSNDEIAAAEKDSIDAAALAFVDRLYAGEPDAALAAMSSGAETPRVRAALDALVQGVRADPGAGRTVRERHQLLHVGPSTGGTPCIRGDSVATLANGGGLRTAFVVVAEAVGGGAERSWTLWLVRERQQWRVRKFNVGLSAIAGSTAADFLAEAHRQQARGHAFNATLLYDLAAQAADRGSFFQSADGNHVAAARAVHERHPELPADPPYAFVLGRRSFPLQVVKPLGDGQGDLALVLTRPAGAWRGVDDAERSNRALIEAMNARRGEWREVFDYLVVQTPMNQPGRSWGTVYRREGRYVAAATP